MSQERISSSEFKRLYGGGIVSPPSTEKPAIRLPKKRVLNKTEEAFIRWASSWWKGSRVRAHPLRLELPSGTHYTPDAMVTTADGKIILVEVKARRNRTQNERSPHAFKEARAAYPEFSWLWAEKNGTEWRIAE